MFDKLNNFMEVAEAHSFCYKSLYGIPGVGKK